MLFFKSIKDTKLSDPDFEAFYAEECHICSLTLKVIEKLEETDKKQEILDHLGISQGDYNALKEGDCCQPEQVMALSRHTGIDMDNARPCPRMKKT